MKKIFIFVAFSMLFQPALHANSLQVIRPHLKRAYPAIFEGLSTTFLRYTLVPKKAPVPAPIFKPAPTYINKPFSNARGYQSTFMQPQLPRHTFPPATFNSNSLNIHHRYYSNSPKINFSNKSTGFWDQVYDLAETLEDKIKNPDTSLRDVRLDPTFFGYRIPFLKIGLPQFFIDAVENAANPVRSWFVSESVFYRIQEVNDFDIDNQIDTDSIDDVYGWISQEGPWAIKIHVSDNTFSNGEMLLGHSFVLEKTADGYFHRYQSNNIDSLLSFMNESKNTGSQEIKTEDVVQLIAGLEILLKDPEVWSKQKRDLLLLFKGYDVSNVDFIPQDLDKEFEFQASFSSR